MTVRYRLPSASTARIDAYDMMGRKVGVLVDSVVPSGLHESRWAPDDLSSGLYVLRLETASGSRVVPVVLIY